MPIDQEIVEQVTLGLERAWERGRLTGQGEARAQFFGNASVRLTTSMFVTMLNAAASAIGSYSPEAAAFYTQKANEFQAFATPARVRATDPAANATGVAATANVNVQFEAAVDPATLTDTNFYVTPAGGGAHLAGAISYDGDTTTATFNPTNDFTSGVSYRVTLTGVRAVGGQPLAQPVTWTFTVA